MEGCLMPWWITVPAVLAVLVAAGYAALAVRIRLNGPGVRRQWHAAVQAEIREQKVKADA
jgi:hypothetical protein